MSTRGLWWVWLACTVAAWLALVGTSRWLVVPAEWWQWGLSCLLFIIAMEVGKIVGMLWKIGQKLHREGKL